MAKVRFGLSNVYVAERVETEGVISMLTPQKLDGAVNLTVTKNSEKYTFRADNIDYFKRFISSAREGTLEVALVPDWFKEKYLGYMKDENDKLVETNKPGKPFALIFQNETDVANKKYCIFNCTSSVPDEEHHTTEANDLGVETSVLNLTMEGEVVGDYVAYIKEVDDFSAPTIPVLQ